MLWRFSANHTHLYPGAVLRCLESSCAIRLSMGDDLVVEFSDGVVANGRILQVEPDAAILKMPSYRTQRKTTIAERAWRIVSGDEAGLMRVQKRMPV